MHPDDTCGCMAPATSHPLDRLDRRDLFSRIGAGLTGLALAQLLHEDAARAEPARTGTPAAGPHFPARAKAVIQLFQHGGPSHMDLFDPKPELTRRDGQPMPKYFTDLVSISAHGGLLASPYKFAPAGQSGVEYSEIVPHIASCAETIAFVRW